jgi:hypothetical protein
MKANIKKDERRREAPEGSISTAAPASSRHRGESLGLSVFEDSRHSFKDISLTATTRRPLQAKLEVSHPDDLPPNAIAAIDMVAIETLRAMAIGALNHAYSNYQSAGRAVTDGLRREKERREEREKEFVNTAIGAAGLLLSPMSAAVGAAVAGPALHKSLVSKLEEAVPRILAKEGADMETRQASTDAFISKIANERATALLAKLTPEAATGLVSKAASAAAGVMAKVDVRGSVEEKTSSFVEALEKSADKSSSSLLTALGLCTDPGALIGVHAQFSSATEKLYQTQIDTAARHFMTQVGSAIGSEGKSQAQVKGGTQIGGISQIDTSLTKGLQKPAD